MCESRVSSNPCAFKPIHFDALNFISQNLEHFTGNVRRNATQAAIFENFQTILRKDGVFRFRLNHLPFVVRHRPLVFPFFRGNHIRFPDARRISGYAVFLGGRGLKVTDGGFWLYVLARLFIEDPTSGYRRSNLVQIATGSRIPSRFAFFFCSTANLSRLAKLHRSTFGIFSRVLHPLVRIWFFIAVTTDCGNAKCILVFRPPHS